MANRLCIFGCHNFHAELAAAVAAEGWQDVSVVAFPTRCGRPPLSWDELAALLPPDCSQVLILGRACIGRLKNPPPGFPPLRLERLEQCFNLLAPSHLVAEAITGGAYLITPSWLIDWRGQLAAMGFSPETGGEFFQDFARELVLLDTGVVADSEQRFAELQQALALPARRLAVGLEQTRHVLGRLVLEWRLERQLAAAAEQEKRHVRELANHVSAMDLLTGLAKTQNESAAIAAIEELFSMLFAPAALHYLKVDKDLALPVGDIPADIQAQLESLSEDYAWTADGRGFLLCLGQGEQAVGRIAVLGLAFPEHRERYLNMALVMIGVCALAIENARNRKKRLEAEKMASLGILVAGVAHEINTPVGVALAAASCLQEQATTLAGHFAQRSMTQSELEGYLVRARQASALIRSNLERIGQLVDAFRQVAVADQPLVKRRFKLRACLEQVIASLGESLSGGAVALRIQCAPELEINSLAGDWASIFTNLISNSLKHGFKGRGRGCIDIDIVTDGQGLSLDYRDDGQGMSADSLARIFDPFFTTDLQHGMGLGMHLVYNIVTQRLGGHIQCASKLGQGVHFQVKVPS